MCSPTPSSWHRCTCGVRASRSPPLPAKSKSLSMRWRAGCGTNGDDCARQPALSPNFLARYADAFDALADAVTHFGLHDDDARTTFDRQVGQANKILAELPVAHTSRRGRAVARAVRGAQTHQGTSTQRSTSLTTPEMTKDGAGFLDWMFRSRKTGRITLVQLPNWSLTLWLLTSGVMWLVHPQGWVRAVLVVLSSAALALWAADELLRGVNPFRRLLGLAMLAWLVFSLVRLG